MSLSSSDMRYITRKRYLYWPVFVCMILVNLAGLSYDPYPWMYILLFALTAVFLTQLIPVLKRLDAGWGFVGLVALFFMIPMPCVTVVGLVAMEWSLSQAYPDPDRFGGAITRQMHRFVRFLSRLNQNPDRPNELSQSDIRYLKRKRRVYLPLFFCLALSQLSYMIYDPFDWGYTPSWIFAVLFLWQFFLAARRVGIDWVTLGILAFITVLPAPYMSGFLLWGYEMTVREAFGEKQETG